MKNSYASDVLYSVAIGPFFGAAVFVVIEMVITLISPVFSSRLVSVVAIAASFPFTVVLAYIFGILPSLICGPFIAFVHRKRFDPVPSYLLVSLVGSAVLAVPSYNQLTKPLDDTGHAIGVMQLVVPASASVMVLWALRRRTFKRADKD